MGMRITTNNMQVTQNTDPKKIEVLPVYRSDIFTTAFDSLNPASLNTTQMGPHVKYNSTGGYMNNGGFIKFIKGNTTLTEAMTITKYKFIH